MIIMLTMIYFLMTSTFNIPSTSTSSWLLLTLYIYISGTDPDGGARGAEPPLHPNFIFVILYFIFVVGPPLLPQSV